MRDRALRSVLLAGMLLTAVVGCTHQKFTATILNPLNLELPFLPYQKPVRVGIVYENKGIFDPATWDVANIGSPWTPLRARMQRKLGAPVQIVELEPFQVAAHLQSGRLQFAFLGASDYVALRDEFGPLGQVLAVSDVRERQGLIVTLAGSNVASLADLAGKRFAFGPMNDAVLDTAAKQVLLSAGIPPDSLQKELLPLPNTFQHHISSKEAAYEVVYGLGTAAGVIEKSEYDAYPETGGNIILRTFSKANFRVLGATDPVRVDTISAGPFLASVETDVSLVRAMRDFLLNAATDDRAALFAMGLEAFRMPSVNVDEELRQMSTVLAPRLARDIP